MSRHRRVDPAPHLRMVAEAEPAAVCAALDKALGAVLGHKLFTVMRYHADTGESERIYTNQPDAYPLGGRKAMNPTPWARQVIQERRPYLGRTADDVKTVFFDWPVIASLGCDSVLNLPLVHDGRLLGTVNLLHEAHWYDDDDVSVGLAFASTAAPAFSRAR